MSACALLRLSAVEFGEIEAAFQEDQDVYVLSGCQDHQTSADAFLGWYFDVCVITHNTIFLATDGKYRGALTWALCSCLKEADYDLTYRELITAIRAKLEGEFEQIPRMSSGVRAALLMECCNSSGW